MPIATRKCRDKLAVIDLFAGAGGLGLGAEMAGGRVALSVELDRLCCDTLSRNGASPVLRADVSQIGGEEIRRAAGLVQGEPVIVVGGPPCQPFSKASYWTDPGEDSRFRRARARGKRATRPAPILVPRPDSRRSLLQEYCRLVAESDAVGFVMENVPSILHPRNRPTFDHALAALGRAGYLCTVVKLNAANFGVPQQRTRVFVLGAKEIAPAEPRKTHRVSTEDPPDLLPAVGVGPALEPFAGAKFAEEGEAVSGRWAAQLRQIPPGWNYKFLTQWAGHPEPVFEAETRFWNFLLKLDPTRPSWTVNANPGPWVGPFHWTSRRLRTAELAAIQTFPNGYAFHGTRRERIRQIGNAVPALLAGVAIGKVIEAVSAIKPRQHKSKRMVLA